MSPFASEGTFTSESREVAVSETWDTWANPQAMNNVEVVDGSLQLAEATPPDTEDWQTPTVATDNSRDGDANLTVDDDTGTYSILEQDGYVEWSSGVGYKQIRFHFADFAESVDVTLEPSGTVLREDWDVQGDPWYVISLEDELAEGWETTENYRVTVVGSSNRSVAETDVDIDV